MGKNTVVQNWFGGLLQSQICCFVGAQSNTFDPVLDLSLELHAQGHGVCRSLDEALRRFTKPEYLEGENGYKCETCKSLTRAKKHFTVAVAPKVLTIHLKRFSFDFEAGGASGKITSHVAFPPKLDLAPYMVDAGEGGTTEPCVYRLCARSWSTRVRPRTRVTIMRTQRR